MSHQCVLWLTARYQVASSQFVIVPCNQVLTWYQKVNCCCGYWQHAIIKTLWQFSSVACHPTIITPTPPTALFFYLLLFISFLFFFIYFYDFLISEPPHIASIKKKKKTNLHIHHLSIWSLEIHPPRCTNTPTGRQIFAFWLAGASVSRLSRLQFHPATQMTV